MNEQFCLELLNCQDQLRNYIATMVIDRTAVDDVLQDTNAVLCNKWDEYQLGTDFASWACRIAYYQVLALRRDTARSKLRFSDECLALVASHAEEQSLRISERLKFLRECLKRLSPDQMTLLRRRYYQAAQVEKIAKETGKSTAAIVNQLYRIRKKLQTCVEYGLRTESLS
ncbi:MAG: sigma-70 family RNA polymerase sigma factor [Pirellulales bacterium]|nr:sigma-70 family RNA polymerase sigma factor [Pirellulales bacterium]